MVVGDVQECVSVCFQSNESVLPIYVVFTENKSWAVPNFVLI